MVFACNNPQTTVQETTETSEEIAVDFPKRSLSEAFKKHWFDGNAELSVYQLRQLRYGELRSGTADMIFVTEPFNPKLQVKADRPNSESLSVFKLNATRKFLTGIYPYSTMVSSFVDLTHDAPPVKYTASIQEWCGQTFTQFNRGADYTIQQNSYFESEADTTYTIAHALMEHSLMQQIRINPEQLPTGEQAVVPFLEYIRFKHIPAQAYEAELSIDSAEENLMKYRIAYNDINRVVDIYYEKQFPHKILRWTETYDEQTTSATLNHSQRIDYWSKNKAADTILRKAFYDQL
ncbi:MAG: septum formation inhibitor Maf [Flavobacteriaceae bacterium]|nr:septum formation inhibitor Maf [Flavobacteriaceae bacterium]